MRNRSSSPKGGPARAPPSSSALPHHAAGEAGLMSHASYVSEQEAPTSSRLRTSAFPPSRSHLPSPRQASLSLWPVTPQMPPAPVVRAPPEAQMRSRSPSPTLLIVDGSAPGGSGSRGPSRSPSPSSEPESDGSPGYLTTDSNDDRLHGYATPVAQGPNLFIRTSPWGGLVCPVCPNRKPRGWDRNDARQHVLSQAKVPRDATYTVPTTRRLPGIAPLRGMSPRCIEGIVRPPW